MPKPTTATATTTTATVTTVPAAATTTTTSAAEGAEAATPIPPKRARPRRTRVKPAMPDAAPAAAAGAGAGELTAPAPATAPALALAPGNITPVLMSFLSSRFSPEYIAGKISDLLEATHVTARGQITPDNRAREAGLKLLLHYLIGVPTQRREVVQLNLNSLEDLQRRAQHSPALKAAVEKVIQEESQQGT